MKYQAILFDLDGTLLPMDFDEFTGCYLSLLAKAVAPYGFEKESMLAAMWQGVGAMVKNDGSRLNSQAFWETFASILGPSVLDNIADFDRFYSNEFHKAKAVTQPTDEAILAVEAAHRQAERVILATNPVFPLVATRSRLSWAGLRESNFDLVTHYDNCATCKPNPAYYLAITSAMGLDPERCLMIGNNVEEDILPALSVGMSAFLLTRCLMSKSEILPDVPHGDFDALLRFLEE